MSKALIRARNLHKSYAMGRTEVRVLRGASLTAETGEFLVIMGASGSGKSTLLHLLGALDVPDRGTVEFKGQDLREVRIPQNYGIRSIEDLRRVVLQ